MVDMETNLLTIKETMEIAKVSRHTVFKDIKAGKLPALYFGRNVRIKESDAMAYAEEKAANGIAPYYKNRTDENE